MSISFITAFGPAFSIAAGIVFLLLARRFPRRSDVFVVLLVLGIANVLVGAGNLLPVQPMDGWRLFVK